MASPESPISPLASGHPHRVNGSKGRLHSFTAMKSAQFTVRELKLDDLKDDCSNAIQEFDRMSELNQVEVALSKAFADDLFTAVVTANPKTDSDSKEDPAPHVVLVAETDEKKDTGRKIIGCAVWFGPGYSMYDTAGEQEHALGPLMASSIQIFKTGGQLIRTQAQTSTARGTCKLWELTLSISDEAQELS
ncbi:hypothetical protein B0H13DRAFT_1893806 [Mycena leptocephala]|nr:hypothetical protein B0H13DRAFT_1893806 [Mycena leptocephala]